MKFREWIKKHIKEIIIGVIVSIITTAVLNAADWIKEFAPTAGNSVWVFLSNSFFSSAAKMTETSLISFLFSVAIAFWITYIFSIAFKGFKLTKRTIKESQDIINDIDNNNLIKPIDDKDITRDDIKREATDIIKEGKKIRKLLIGACIFCSIYLGFIITFDVIPHVLWTDYQMDLIKIAPYIEQQELDEIKSDWVCMQSKEDYDDIYNRINKIKEEHDLP